MSMKYLPSRKWERSVAAGRAEGIVDCEAWEVAAWLFDYCSRDRMRISKERGNPARLIVEKDKEPNEIVAATIKSMVFPLTDREYVVRMVWNSHENGSVSIAVENVDDDYKVDYGTSFKTVRGHTRCLYRIENLPDLGQVKQCKTILYHYLDAGGIISPSLSMRGLRSTLNVIHTAVEEFRQDELLDSETRDRMMKLMRDRYQTQVYSKEELARLKNTRRKFEGLKESEFVPLPSPDLFVKIEKVREQGSSVLVGRATAIVDATIEECAAWEWEKTTRERIKKGREDGTLEKNVKVFNEHSDEYRTVFSLATGTQPREILVNGIWKKDDENTQVCVYSNATSKVWPIQNHKAVRASVYSLWKFQKLPHLRGVPQTRVVFYGQADPKGIIPKTIVNLMIAFNLGGSLACMRKKFDKSFKIERAIRANLTTQIERMLVKDEAAESASKTFDELFESRSGRKITNIGFGLAKAWSKIEKSMSWGQISVPIRATLEEVAAFFWHFDSRASTEMSGDLERKIEYAPVGSSDIEVLQAKVEHRTKQVRMRE